MRIEEKKIIIKCDLCNTIIQEEDLFKGVSDSFRYGLKSMVYVVWYGKEVIVNEICYECNKKLMTFIYDEFLQGK